MAVLENPLFIISCVCVLIKSQIRELISKLKRLKTSKKVYKALGASGFFLTEKSTMCAQFVILGKCPKPEKFNLKKFLLNFQCISRTKCSHLQEL